MPAQVGKGPPGLIDEPWNDTFGQGKIGQMAPGLQKLHPQEFEVVQGSWSLPVEEKMWSDVNHNSAEKGDSDYIIR